MPRVEIPQFEFKVVMLGDMSTGKTSLIYRFTQGYYRDDGHPSTTGAVFSVKKIQTIGGVTCNVQIWDTAGVPERTKFAHLYYKTADAAIICYDIENPQSYEVLCIWLEELRRHMSERNLVVAIAVTKMDLNVGEKSTMSASLINDAKELAAKYNCIFILTSAKTNKSIHELFQVVADRVFLFKDQPKTKHHTTIIPVNGTKTTHDSTANGNTKKLDGNHNVNMGVDDESKAEESMMEYILPVAMTKGSCCVIS